MQKDDGRAAAAGIAIKNLAGGQLSGLVGDGHARYAAFFFGVAVFFAQ